jgi:nitrogen fixation protein FixH
MTDPQHTGTPAWKSPWVIGWVLLVVTVLGVNLFMVLLAINTSPGLVNEDFYERGQDYEKTLFSKRANDPGWHMQIDLPKQIVAGNHTPVNFTVRDKAGIAVPADSVTFFAYRPSDAKRDFSLAMDQIDKGLYSTKAQFRLKGFWDVLVSVKKDGEEYNIGERIVVRAPDEL